MARLFGVVDRGDADLNVPAHNGGLFISKPRAADESAEANAARFLADQKVPDLNILYSPKDLCSIKMEDNLNPRRNFKFAYGT
jgi:hypothetical protein